MKKLNNQKLWIFELGSQVGMNVPKWIIVGFQQRDGQNSQNLNNDTFCRLPVSSAQFITSTEKWPDAGLFLTYDEDDYSQGCAQIEDVSRTLTKNDTLPPYFSDHDLRSSNVRDDDVGYNLYVFDIRYQQISTVSQPIKVDFIFDGVVPNDVNGYALVLTNKLVSVSSDG